MMDTDLVLYEWECPVCGKSNRGLTSESKTTREHAETILVGHLQRTTGHGHGTEGEFPEGFAPTDAREYISVKPRDEPLDSVPT